MSSALQLSVDVSIDPNLSLVRTPVEDGASSPFSLSSPSSVSLIRKVLAGRPFSPFSEEAEGPRPISPLGLPAECISLLGRVFNYADFARQVVKKDTVCTVDARNSTSERMQEVLQEACDFSRQNDLFVSNDCHVEESADRLFSPASFFREPRAEISREMLNLSFLEEGETGWSEIFNNPEQLGCYLSRLQAVAGSLFVSLFKGEEYRKSSPRKIDGYLKGQGRHFIQLSGMMASFLPAGCLNSLGVTVLSLSNMGSPLPRAITGLSSVRVLSLDDPRMLSDLSGMGNLSTLILTNCDRLSKIPSSLFKLKSLRNVICDRDWRGQKGAEMFAGGLFTCQGFRNLPLDEQKEILCCR